MSFNVLVAPSHYIFSDEIKSEVSWAYTLVKLLGKKIDNMDILCGVSDIHTKLDDNIHVHSLFRKRSNSIILEFIRHLVFYPLITFQAFILLRKKKYNIVHHMFPLSYATVNPLVFIVKMFYPNIKVIMGPLQLPQEYLEEQDLNVVLIGKQNYSLSSKIIYFATNIIVSVIKPVARLMFEAADLVVCVSNKSYDHYSKLFPKAKFKVIYAGIDISDFNYSINSNKSKSINIISVGSFTKRKGQLYLLNAMVSLIKKFPFLKLTLVGEGEQETVYKQFVASHSLGKNVNFTGQLSHDDVRKEYSNSHIFCLPSLSDSFPNVILEAMSFGLPTVATDTGSIKEMLGNSGIVVPPGNANFLDKAITRIINDSKLRNFMSKVGHKRVLEYFTWEKIISQWLALYKTI